MSASVHVKLPCVCGSTEVGVPIVQGRSRGGDRVNIRPCNRCGLARTYPPPDVERLIHTDYQSDEDVRHHAQNLKRFRQYACNLLNVIERHLPSERRFLLDVGCNIGALLLEAKHRGWRCFGIDINKKAIEYARTELGLDVEAISMEDLSRRDERFDAITLTQVLEHLPRPHDAIRLLLDLVTPGGIVAIESPNMKGLFPRLLGPLWYGYGVRQHLWHFTQETIGVVAREADAELVDVSSRSNLDYGLPLELVDLPARLFNCGDNLVAVFRRPSYR